MVALSKQFISVDDYLQFAEYQEGKHEYIYGINCEINIKSSFLV